MYRELTKKLNCALNLKRNIVGVKFFADKNEYDSDVDLESKCKVSYCYMVNLASKGKLLKVKYENFNCLSSARALGLAIPEERHQNGEEYFSYGLYRSKEVAEEVQKSVLYATRRIYGIKIKPLDEFKENCDMVIAIADPYNVMRIVQGYVFSYGPFDKMFSVANQGLCSELTVRPYINREINASFLCSNSRFYCKWGDDEMGVAFPEELCRGIFSGVLETVNSSETDKRKKAIIDKLKKAEISQDIVLGKNYFLDTTGKVK
ncbi:hypothetical protein EUAN_06630 [Andreesenia angusta]|uniref:Uncharacterized protein n=1 Tax=Andreesenia angusta TaxID=39480 RepID=A0A1S1VAN5_9FIRM|nr:hypothetical protein EUAN_06630 [Andreesenia angusta]